MDTKDENWEEILELRLRAGFLEDFQMLKEIRRQQNNDL